MSDFLTRLVQRQAGIASLVQPRTPSMFAPPASRIGPTDLPVLDPSFPIDESHPARAESLRPGRNGGEALTRPGLQEGQGPILPSRPAQRATEEPRPARGPTPLVRQVSAGVNQPCSEMMATPRADSFTAPEERPPQQTGLSGRHIQGPVDSAVNQSPRRMAPLPRLVEARHDTARSFPTAPPSLVLGLAMGMRAERNPAASTQPPVEVTIGRIEVTAVSAAPDRKQKAVSRRPAMSLDEYLSRRRGGRP